MSSTISSARHPLLESNNTEGKDLFVLRVPSEPPDVWSCCRPFIHPTIANTKQTFSSFSFLTLLPSLSSSSSFCFFFFFFLPPVVVMSVPQVSGNELNISVLVGRAQLLLKGLNAERCLRGEQQWR